MSNQIDINETTVKTNCRWFSVQKATTGSNAFVCSSRLAFFKWFNWCIILHTETNLYMLIEEYYYSLLEYDSTISGSALTNSNLD